MIEDMISSTAWSFFNAGQSAYSLRHFEPGFSQTAKVSA